MDEYVADEYGGYRFIQCEGCKNHLPVGVSWDPDTEVKCQLCETVQEVGEAEEADDWDELPDGYDMVTISGEGEQ